MSSESRFRLLVWSWEARGSGCAMVVVMVVVAAAAAAGGPEHSSAASHAVEGLMMTGQVRWTDSRRAAHRPW